MANKKYTFIISLFSYPLITSLDKGKRNGGKGAGLFFSPIRNKFPVLFASCMIRYMAIVHNVAHAESYPEIFNRNQITSLPCFRVSFFLFLFCFVVFSKSPRNPFSYFTRCSEVYNTQVKHENYLAMTYCWH